eukprot:3933238-Rhodomonas_salina.12
MALRVVDGAGVPLRKLRRRRYLYRHPRLGTKHIPRPITLDPSCTGVHPCAVILLGTPPLDATEEDRFTYSPYSLLPTPCSADPTPEILDPRP